MKFPYRTLPLDEENYHTCRTCNENPVFVWNRICQACFDTIMFNKEFNRSAMMNMKYVDFVDTYWPGKGEPVTSAINTR